MVTGNAFLNEVNQMFSDAAHWRSLHSNHPSPVKGGIRHAPCAEMSSSWNGDPSVPDLRSAAYVIAVRRLDEIYKALGT